MKTFRKVTSLLLAALMLASLAACGGSGSSGSSGASAPAASSSAPAASGSSAAPAASSSSSASTESTESTEPESDLVVDGVALLLCGAISDMGYNYGAYLGLEKIAEMGYRTNYTENIADTDCENMLRAFTEQDYELILGHGYQWAEPILTIAKEHPEKYYFAYAAAPCDESEIPENACYLQALEYEAAYVCGAVAAKETKTGVVGIVTGAPAAMQVGNINGFREGALSVNPDINVMYVMTGTFTDPAKGKEAALAMIEQDCDVLLHTCDATGTGVIDACNEKGVMVMGYGGDQRELAPDLMATSIVVDTAVGFARQIDRIADGTFSGIDKAGFNTGVVYMAPWGDNVSEETVAFAEQLVEDISSGKVVPTENLVSYE